MGSIHKTPLFFKPKELFGLDVGKGSLKVAQVSLADQSKPRLIGYGATTFDPSALNDGTIVKPELIAEAAHALFKNGLIGDITSRQCAFAIPAYRTFTRSMSLPILNDRELAEAVRMEAEEYIPTPLDEMYLDYSKISEDKETINVLAVAVPRVIIDSYIELAAIMGVEPVLIETTMIAVGRVFSLDQQSSIPSVIIDIGSYSSDVSIYDQGVVTTGTVDVGGEVFNEAIQKALKVNHAEAGIIKNKYGLTKSRRQSEIQAALDPSLTKIITEIKRLLRYHAERFGPDRPIQQILTAGGGANMPGLSDYMTSNLRLAVRSLDPWYTIDVHELQPPNRNDRPMFAAAIGLSLAPPNEVTK